MRIPHVLLFAVAAVSANAVASTVLLDASMGPAALSDAVKTAGAGDTILLAPGTYALAETLKLGGSGDEHGPITFASQSPTERVVLDFSAQPYGKESRGIQINGDYWIVRNIEVIHAGDNGINIAGNHNMVDRCVVRECQDSGIQIATGGGYNTISNCDSFRNVDVPNRGENADGFAAKGKIGPGNVFRGCRAWENCDDGFDFWESPQSIRLEDCIAFRNGIDFWNIDNFAGDGNGFKLGGNHVAGNHTLVRCFTSEQSLRGFNLNNNTGAQTLIDCVAVNCAVGFYLPTDPKDGSQHTLKGCVSINSPDVVTPNAKLENNRLSTTQPTTQNAD